MDLEFDCSECAGDKLRVCTSVLGDLWFEVSAEETGIPQVRLTASDARVLAHAILAEVG